MSSGRRPTPKPLADALRAVRARVEPETPLAAVQSAWPEAVGEEIAAHAHRSPSGRER